eukprot:TRINITY_DN4096_c0_g1_i4.p1 TRINITY_DN4096_c0_g1~~TRINITY_DN4096_c0_g1_i4.p1  ORF type:complete len:545 (+),score=40.28 TRINITY_DN4096_c0_g1_i4:175-1809(+)
MDIRASNYGNWDSFAMYLKTHPANPDQLASDIESISWMMMIRLARNIFCHERYFDWRGLRELDQKMLEYFKLRENIVAMFELYEKKCTGNFSQKNKTKSDEDLSVSVVHEVASIQIYSIDNVGILSTVDQKDLKLFVGLNPLRKVVSQWIQQIKQVRNNKVKKKGNTPRDRRTEIFLVLGGIRTGKSTIARHIVPFMLHEYLGEYYPLYINFTNKTFSDLKEPSYQDVLKFIATQIYSHFPFAKKEQVPSSTISEDFLLQFLSEHGYNRVLIMDDFQHAIFGLSSEEQGHLWHLLSLISIPNRRGQGPCIVISGDIQLAVSFEICRQKRKSSLDKLYQVPLRKMYVTPFSSNQEDLKDCQLLLRHYCNVDKYHLKYVLNHMHPSLINCSNLVKLSQPCYRGTNSYLSIKQLVGEHIGSTVKDVYNNTYLRLKQIPENYECLKQLINNGTSIKSAGLIREMCIQRGAFMFLKDPILHSFFFLDALGDGILDVVIERGIKNPLLWQELILLLPLSCVSSSMMSRTDADKLVIFFITLNCSFNFFFW